MLNKKALRRFAAENPAPAIQANHGLLRAEQVAYIVRTAVKIIDHRRTLVLFIYDREQAAGGDNAPVWTAFQSGKDYITLEKRDEGSTRWREAAFENLSRKYYIPTKCAFYSAKDEQRVQNFFHDTDHGGIAALIRAQRAIVSRRRHKREQERDKIIRARMKSLPALPRDLATWAHTNVMPAYFFYDHAKHGKAAGACTSCGQKATLTGVKFNVKGVCPHCGRALTMKPKGRIGRLFDRETFQILQRTKTGELVVRIIKATCAYFGEHQGTLVYENARQFLSVDGDDKVHCDRYYYSHGDGKWKQGERPVMFPYQYNFAADVCGHVYCKNLPKAIAGTPWRYCPVQKFYEHFREPMQMWPFLAAHVEHPKLEHLVKVGFYDLACDLAYDRVGGTLLDETQNRTHRILQVAAEDVDFLRELNVNAETLRIFQQYAGVKDRQQLLLWQKERDVSRDIIQCLEHTTAHKFMRYMGQQYLVLLTRKTAHGGKHYWDIQAVVTEYRDYLGMCVRLGYDLRNSFVLFPKDLEEAHDRVQRRVKIKNNIQLRKDFEAAMKSISKNLDFEMESMKILIPSSLEAIIAEGQALHHCVGTYAERVARRECIILFLRLSDNLDKPYYTIEVRNRKAVQVRGMKNCAPTPEVQAFVDSFEQKVLMPAAA